VPAADEELLITPVPRGAVRPATWGEVAVGDIVQDKKDRLHAVVRLEGGQVWLLSAKLEEVAMQVPPADRPVNIYVPSEREAENIAHPHLGASYLRDIEHREHMVAKALLWRMDPIPNNATALRDHIDMAHGVYVNDVLGRYNSGVEAQKGLDPDKKKEGAKKKKASLEELRAAHDEFHSDFHLWPQNIVHHHAKE